MRKLTAVLMATLLCGLTVSAAVAAGGDAVDPMGADYRLGPGDVLLISAWKNDDLTREVTVLPDSRITFPLVGELQAGGRTVGQLRDEIVSRLKRFVPNPDLTIMVKQVNSLWVYVIGRVNQPGRFLVNSNINVLQALAMAGGLNSFAKRGDIKVFRAAAGKTRIFEFDYDDVSAGRNLEQNIVLERGDVVVVR